MAVTLGQLRASIYRRLGTGADDPEYPPEQLLVYVNQALAELHHDCARLNENVLLVAGVTLQATADRTYAFAQQSPPIGAVEQVRRVAAGDWVLREVPFSQLEGSEGTTYALTGPSDALVLLTHPRSAARAALSLVYIAGPPSVAQDGDPLPAFLPDQYRDVVEYLVVREALAQGDEARMPPTYAERLFERRSMLWEHWTSRTPDQRRRAELAR